MSAQICKRSFRDGSVSRILFGRLAMSLSMCFTVFVEKPGAVRPIEIMPFAGTKTECNEDGE